MDLSLLEEAARAGRLQNDIEYSLRDILSAIEVLNPTAEWVTQFKEEMVAQTVGQGGVQCAAVGSGRRRRYRWSGLPAPTPATLAIHRGDNLSVLQRLPDDTFDLIYIDPPFNTGREQSHTRVRTVTHDEGDRVGFEGKRYKTVAIGTRSFGDTYDDFLQFLEPRLQEARRVLRPDGAFFFHIDYREAHYCKVLLDQIFGRASFMNEIVWAYDYGARSKRRWSAKHDVIFWYAANPKKYTFNFDAMDRIPYMAPGLVSPEKAARGKTPTDVWWHTIVPTSGHERTGYPTQKPLGILRRIISVHTNPGDEVLDFFAGSGTTGAAALELGRSATLVDQSADAMSVMETRFAGAQTTFYGWEPSSVASKSD